MKRLIGLNLVLNLALVPLALATQSTWVNNGTIVIAPNIDATNVINNGTMSISTPYLPFDTSNTRNFTNNGVMQGSVGFRFDYSPENSSGQSIGARRLAANFHNRAGGNVEVFDGVLASGFTGSYLLVHATNVINQGTLASSVGGVVQIVGTNVNLSRSGLGVASLASFGTGSINDTNEFLPDTAIYDNYWGQTNAFYNTGGIINGAGILPVTSPQHNVQGSQFFARVQILQNAWGAAYTNVGGTINLSITNDLGEVTNRAFATNISRQVVFVSSPDLARSLVDIRFYPSTSPTNLMRTVEVVLQVSETNVVSAGTAYNQLYFYDTLASETNYGTLLNAVDGTRRPANYLLARVPSFVNGAPATPNAPITPDFLWATNFGSPNVTAPYAGYSAFVDNLTYRPPAIPAGTVTNLPGRVEITAHSLDMSRARIGTAGYISVKAKHLISSSNAVVDCENLSYELASTNGVLHVQNLTKEFVEKLRGDLYAWSGFWTNAITEIIDNYDTSTNPAVYTPITNIVSVGLHALLLDASQMLVELPVLVHDFKAKGTNIFMHDDGTIVSGFILDGESFTLSGNVTLAGSVPDWVFTNAPALKYFTNNGSLTVGNEAHFGDDGPASYLAFVNRGTIVSAGQTIEADYVELAGTNLAGSSFVVNAGDAKVENGSVDALSDIIFVSDTLKLNRALVQTGARIYFEVADSLFDNGAASSNNLSCEDGFILIQKPVSGDLLGTTIQTIAPNFASISHWWAAEDRGAANAGYANNAALGRLIPVGGIDSLFVFSGLGAANALYVDELDLSQLTDYANQLQLDPGLSLYYAAVKLPNGVTPPGGQTPEEFMDNQYGGRLHWVQTYAGAYSSVDVLINGNQTIKVNRALRFSKLIDSDADGVPNFFDLSPFDGVITTLQVQTSPPGYRISWTAATKTIYRVETRTSSSADWTVLTETMNPGATPAPWSVVDTNLAAGVQRFYRVSYNPNGL